MGENHFESAPTALYGVVLFMAAISYTILQKAIITKQGANSILSKAVGKNIKGHISVLLYLSAIPLAFYREWISQIIYVIVALIWLVPDRRIEKVL